MLFSIRTHQLKKEIKYALLISRYAGQHWKTEKYNNNK